MNRFNKLTELKLIRYIDRHLFKPDKECSCCSLALIKRNAFVCFVKDGDNIVELSRENVKEYSPRRDFHFYWDQTEKDDWNWYSGVNIKTPAIYDKCLEEETPDGTYYTYKSGKIKDLVDDHSLFTRSFDAIITFKNIEKEDQEFLGLKDNMLEALVSVSVASGVVKTRHRITLFAEFNYDVYDFKHDDWDIIKMTTDNYPDRKPFVNCASCLNSYDILM